MSTTTTIPELADRATTPAALLADVVAMREIAEAAQVETLRLAAEWARAHPVLPGDQAWRLEPPAAWHPGETDPSVAEADLDTLEWAGIPPVRWDAPAAFAAANAMSTTAGQALIRDALVLRHRLPLVWARVDAGEVPAWRARQIAQAVLGAPPDVVADVDAHVVGIAHTAGAVTLARLLDEAMLRLHAEMRELAQLEDLDARYVRLDERTLGHTGIADLHARGDWKDLADLDRTLSDLAGVLAEQEGYEHDSLDVRRSRALGVLADPARAAALLAGADELPAPSKRAVLHLHLTPDALRGADTVGRNDATGRAELEQTIRDWCGRTDTHLTVLPVIDLADHVQVGAYEIPDRLRTRVRLLHPHCVFPFCTRAARSCDCDHIEPHAEGGSTCTHNLAPLCRHHHRLKTLAGWTYRPLDPVTDPGTFIWTDPHGLRYLRGPTGTTGLGSR